MAKRIRISDDGGSNFYTFPGSTGDLNEELQPVDDTVFGQEFQSENPNLGMWQVTCNSFLKGVAGYCARLQQGGTPTTMTDEATTSLGGDAYQITAEARRAIDYNTAVTVEDSGGDATSKVVSIDYLNGIVTMDGTESGAVTVTGKYVPMETLAKGRNFTLTQNAQEIDDTDYETACGNGGWKTHEYGLKNAGFEVRGVFDASAGYAAALAARALLMVTVYPDWDNKGEEFRGFFKRRQLGQSGNVGALEEQTQQFGLYVPDGELLLTPFSWYFGSGTLVNTAVQKAIQAWQNGTTVKIQYLQDGTNGRVGDAIVTEATIANAIDGQNEFRFSFRGTGALADV